MVSAKINSVSRRVLFPGSGWRNGAVLAGATLRKEFVAFHDRGHATIEELQAALDTWVQEYNTARPHQSIGNQPPAERFTVPDKPVR